MKTRSDKPVVTIAVLLGAVLLTAAASAVSEEDIVFPIAELGNCANKQACLVYCDETDNRESCIEFARKHNFLPPQEYETIRRAYQAARSGGPGGCQSADACEAYCEQIDHVEECLDFAEERGLLPHEDARQARRIHETFVRGVETPGDCRSRSQCEAYCSEVNHIEECLAFAQEAGLIGDEELKKARKAVQLMKDGKTPGGCRSKEACQEYCSEEENVEECARFGLESGLMEPKEVEIYRKTKGRGPGGCRGDECREFCGKPENQKQCFDFAKEHGLISEDQLRMVEEGRQRMREFLNSAPEEVKQCLRETVGQNILDGIQNGEFLPSPEIGEQIRRCFEQLQQRSEDGFESGFQSEGQPGRPPEGQIFVPGGCSSLEECEQYCLENPQKCGAPVPPQF